MSITVISPTNRESNIENIIANFLRQNFSKKELIIILNYNNYDKELWNKASKDYSNISIYNLGSKISLGNCLNYGISKSKYDYIAKMDDDDYYGPNYLNKSLNSLLRSKADIVGKKSIYIYFENEKILGLRFASDENKFVNRVAGSTLLFRKDICKIVQFRDIHLGEDKEFCKDSIKNGYRIFSSDRNDYIYIRKNKIFHTWKIDNYYLLRKCNYTKEMPNLHEFVQLWQV